jgi:hypothetical protein
MSTKKITQYSGEPTNLEAFAEAIQYLGPKILGKRLWEKYNFWFRIVKIRTSDDAQCWRVRNQIHIRIDSTLSFIDAVVSIAHELVHAKQFLSGELKVVPNNASGAWMWRGKMFRHSNRFTYDTDPWEIEAKSKEFPLAKSFFDASLKKLESSNGSLSKRYVHNDTKNLREIIL